MQLTERGKAAGAAGVRGGGGQAFSFRHTEVESTSDIQVEMLSRDVDTRVWNLLSGQHTDGI